MTDSPLDRLRAHAARTPLVRVVEGAPSAAPPLDRVVQAAAVTPLDLIQLVNVRPYRRVENGRPENVRGHVDNRLPHPGGYAYIPEQDWLKGQRSWVARGEAIWKERGAEKRAADKEKEARAAEKPSPVHGIGADVARHIATSDARRAERAAARAAPGTESAAARAAGQIPPGLPDSPVQVPRKPSVTGSSSIFGAGMLFGGGAAEDATASVHAVFGAAHSSGIYSGSDLAEIRTQITTLQMELRTTAHTARSAHSRISITEAQAYTQEQKRNDSRAELAIGLGALVGGAIFGAITAGLGLPVVLAAAVAVLPNTAQVLAQYYVVEKSSGLQRLIAHPIQHIREAGIAIREGRGAKTAKRALKETKKDITTTAGLGGVLELAASPGGPPRKALPTAAAHGSAQAQTAMVLRMALVAHGLPSEAAVPLADEMARRGVEHALQHLAANRAAAASARSSRT